MTTPPRTLFFETSDNFEPVLNELQRSKTIEICVWVGTNKRCTHHTHNFDYANIKNYNYEGYSKNIYKSIIPFFSDFINMYCRNFRPYSQKIYSAKFLHEYLDIFNILIEHFSQILIKNKIELAFFHRVGHLGSDFLMYKIARLLGIKTLLLANNAFKKDRFFYLTDVSDFGNFKFLDKIWRDNEYINLPKSGNIMWDYMKNVTQKIENNLNVPDTIDLEKSDKNFPEIAVEKKVDNAHIEIIEQKQKLFAQNFYKHIERSFNLNNKYVYFPLQHQPEMTTSAIGDNYYDQILAIEELHELIPSDWKIYVKENPKQTFFQRGQWFYKRIQGLKNVKYLSIDVNSYELIKHSKFTALITGTAGFESLLEGKACLVFGRPWYKTFPGVFHINDNPTIDSIINYKINRNDLENAVNALFEKTGKGYIYHNKEKKINPDFDAEKNTHLVSESIKRIIPLLNFEDEQNTIIINNHCEEKNNVKNLTHIETDWLASRPVFYNEKTSQISHNINDVIDLNNIELHPEGLNNYLDFGYSVFGQTPVKHVKFLPPCSKITKDKNGKISIEHSTDPVEKWIGHESHEDDVLHDILKAVRNWEKDTEGDIILPLSGGYDSRLLGLFIKDKSRIRAFTYGLADKQNQSFEVVYAKTISKILGFDWQQIELGNYHNYFNYWLKHFGISTHSHGMYHIEFYEKILKHINGNNPFLSGIIGDAWAGGVKIAPLHNYNDLNALGYTHGMNADSRMSLLKNNTKKKEIFWENNKKNLEEPLFRLVWAMRFKLILLTYLISIPESFGFKVWSPFLDEKIALGMATLPSHRRKDRIWQTDFFKKHNLNIEAMNIKADKSNTLNYQAIRNNPPSGLSVDILGEIISPHYIRLINAKIKEFIKSDIKPSTLNKNDNDVFKYYCAYLTLKPIEYLLSKNIKK